ncbi:hypothetical protein [Caballeronia sp. SL2Y3]|uniref:hypothetical protein n=1 Tax=Caballeronia sp. SL2Y3 TaxID=2878151 RepID=UPI001FD2BCED|nr:hypothetical protein [Caballeronia sp. SL2Y3]
MKTTLTSVVAFAIGAGGLAFATVSQADNSAAHKLGQIGVINQTLQPKPTKSAPAYSNSNSTSTGSTYGNTANGVNSQNPSNAAANTGAAARAGAAAGSGK